MYLVGGTVRDLLLGRPLDRPTIDLTTDARPTEIKRLVAGLGRRGVDAGRAVRHDRRQARATGPSRSRPTAPRRTTPTRASPTSSFADAHRGRPVAPRLHRQRDGARAARPESGRPVRRRRDLLVHAGCARRCRRTSRSPTTRCGCCGRRASSPATDLHARRRAGRRDRAGCDTGSRSCRPSASATSSTSCSSSTIRPRALVPRRHRAVRRVPARAPGDAARAGSDPPPQGRARPHDRRRRERDASRATASRTDRAARRAVPRRRQAEDPLVRRARVCRSTTTRSSARA